MPVTSLVLPVHFELRELPAGGVHTQFNDAVVPALPFPQPASMARRRHARGIGDEIN